MNRKDGFLYSLKNRMEEMEGGCGESKNARLIFCDWFHA